MGILVGLLTAITWGSADFVARFATRRTGTLRATLYMQILGFFLLSAAMPFLGGWGHIADDSGFRPWAWGISAAFLNTFATLTLILSVLSGERLTLPRAVGIVCILVGAILVARGEAVASAVSATEVAA